jgi:hypothetical protein
MRTPFPSVSQVTLLEGKKLKGQRVAISTAMITVPQTISRPLFCHIDGNMRVTADSADKAVAQFQIALACGRTPIFASRKERPSLFVDAKIISSRSSYLSAVEHGCNEVGAEVLLAISREFGQSLQWLLTGEK